MNKARTIGSGVRGLLKIIQKASNKKYSAGAAEYKQSSVLSI